MYLPPAPHLHPEEPLFSPPSYHPGLGAFPVLLSVSLTQQILKVPPPPGGDWRTRPDFLGPQSVGGICLQILNLPMQIGFLVC